MKVLVTGANGYIGVGVVEQLKKLNIDVIASDYTMSEYQKVNGGIESDIFELDNPYDFFNKPEVVLHLAWRDGFIHNSEKHINDLPKHYSFLQKMITSGVKKVIVLGSMHEVGFWEGCIKEDTPCNPLSLYGIAKNALRQSLGILCNQHGVLFQWIRGFYIVGNTEKGSSIFSKLKQADLEGKETFPFTSGKNQYDFIDYDDFCTQVAHVVMNDEVLGIINCCSGEPESLSSRVERFIKENHLKIKLDYGKFPDRPYDSKAIWGNNSDIMKIMKMNYDSRGIKNEQ